LRCNPSARGVIDVLADSTQNVEPLTLKRLFAWHEAMFPSRRSGLSLILVGRLRGEEPMQVLSGPIGLERVHYEAPPRDRLDAEVDTLLQWFNKPGELDNTLHASIAHLCRRAGERDSAFSERLYPATRRQQHWDRRRPDRHRHSSVATSRPKPVLVDRPER
jgi:hypothetical protein